MANIIAPQPKFQALINGQPAVGSKLFTYLAGTTTKLATYVSSGGAANTNPIILDGRGECDLWLAQGSTYKLVLAPSTDTDPPASPIYTSDNISGALGTADFEAFKTLLASSTGSSLVGHIGSGTGAVARTLQSKVRDTISVKDFGAVGDGIADDTAAINSALAASSSVFFPAGTYKITSNIVMPNGARIHGDSKFTTKILLLGDIEGITVTLQCTVSDLRIIGNASMTTDAAGRYKACLLFGTAAVSAYRFKVSNVIVGGAETVLGDASNIKSTGAGIKTGNAFLFTAEEVYAVYCAVGVESKYVAGVVTNAAVYKQLECQSCTIGMRAGLLNAVTFDSCTWENNDQEGLILGSCRGVVLNAPYFETNNTTAGGSKRADLWIGDSTASGTADPGNGVHLKGGYYSAGGNSLYAIYADNQRGIHIEEPYLISYGAATNSIYIGDVNTSGKVTGFFSNTATVPRFPTNMLNGNYEYTGVSIRGQEIVPLVNTLYGTTAALTPAGTSLLFTPTTGQSWLLTIHSSNNNNGFKWQGIVQSFTATNIAVTTLANTNITITDNGSGGALLTNTHGASTIAFTWSALRIK